jgi:nucleotide-binding universal stress UspA family protein
MYTTPPSGHVVVGADGSERGYAGVRFAAEEAVRRDVPLDVIHVVPGYLPVGPFLMIPDVALQSFGASVTERAAHVACEQAPGVDVTTHLLPGNRVRALVRLSQQAGLLVLAARHLSPVDHLLVGATVTGVVSRAACPVAVVPVDVGLPAEPHRRVVAGYKSPRHSAELFEDAFTVAAELDAELVVLHAWKVEGMYDDMLSDRVQEDRWNAEERAVVETSLEGYRESYPDVPVRVVIVHDRPAHALVRASRTADRLVIVKPAHGGRVHHLGSTARTVLRTAACPVEVVPSSTEPELIPGLTLEEGGDLVR